MYKIKLTETAAGNLKKIEKKTLEKILKKIEMLKTDPGLVGKPLNGPLKGLRSLSAAGQRYKIIFKIINDEVIVIIIAVGIRKDGDKNDIYELMKKYIKTGLLKND